MALPISAAARTIARRVAARGAGLIGLFCVHVSPLVLPRVAFLWQVQGFFLPIQPKNPQSQPDGYSQTAFSDNEKLGFLGQPEENQKHPQLPYWVLGCIELEHPSATQATCF